MPEELNQKERKNQKLTTKDKIAIVSSKKSSRELADEYGVHHSRICNIRLEAEAILAEEWDARQPGRKPKPKEPEKVTEVNQKFETLQRDYELSMMRNDWLNLQMTLMARHAADAGQEELFKRLEKKADTTQQSS